MYVFEVLEVTYTEDFTEKVKKSTLYEEASSALEAGFNAASRYAKSEPFQVLDERSTGFGDYLKLYDSSVAQFRKGSWAVYIKRRKVK